MNSSTPFLTWPQTLKRLGLYLVIELVLQLLLVALFSPDGTAATTNCFR